MRVLFEALDSVFRWEIFAFIAGLPFLYAFGVLSVKRYKAARLWFLAAAGLCWLKLLTWGVLTDMTAIKRISLSALLGAVIAIVLIETLHWVTHLEAQEPQSSSQSVGTAKAAGKKHQQSSSTQSATTSSGNVGQQQQSNSGGTNTQQQTTGKDSPIITQGSGSIAQVGGTGNQATVNNYEPLPPTVTWKHVEVPSNFTSTKYPRAAATLWLDRSWPDAKFGVLCDRPCKGVGTSGVAGYNGADWGQDTENKNLAIFIIHAPNPFPSDTEFTLVVESEDDKTITITALSRLNFAAGHNPIVKQP